MRRRPATPVCGSWREGSRRRLEDGFGNEVTARVGLGSRGRTDGGVGNEPAGIDPPYPRSVMQLSFMMLALAFMLFQLKVSHWFSAGSALMMCSGVSMKMAQSPISPRTTSISTSPLKTPIDKARTKTKPSTSISHFKCHENPDKKEVNLTKSPCVR